MSLSLVEDFLDHFYNSNLTNNYEIIATITYQQKNQMNFLMDLIQENLPSDLS